MDSNFNKSTFAVVGSIAIIGAASAQENAAPALEEVIVTAQKRAESLQEVAGSISALSASQIEMLGVAGTEDLSQLVPGLTYTAQNGHNLVTIRGIGPQVLTGVAEPAVATHIDGVFQPRTSIGALDAIDLDRVEVLRGPQGTLYGRNATGGVLNFISKKPAAAFAGGVTVGVGSWHQQSASAYLGGPLVPGRLLGRVSASYSDHDGYVDNLGSGDRELGDHRQQNFRAALRYLAADALTVDLSVMYQDEQYHPIQQNIDLSQPTLFSIFGITTAPGVLISDRPHETVANSPYPLGNKETTSVTISAEWNISDALTLRSISGYIDHQNGPGLDPGDSTSLELIVIGDPGDPKMQTSEAFSQEINLSGRALDDRLQWTAGLYYFQEDAYSSYPVRFGAIAGPLFGASFAPGISFDARGQAIWEDTQSVAGFLDATYALTERVRLNAGVRQSRDEKDIEQDLPVTITNITPVPIAIMGGLLTVPPGVSLTLPTCGGGAPGGQTEFAWDSTSPKLRLEWDARDGLLLYAQWQEGFKSGGINLSTCDDGFEPEEIVAYEAGFKATLLDGAMILNGSVYRYDYDNLQVMTFDTTGTSALIENVPGSRITGAELELNWAVSRHFRADASVAYADSEITRAVPIIDSSTQALVLAATGDPVAAVAAAMLNPQGNPLPRQPRLTAALGLNLDFDTAAGAVGFRAEARYSDKVQFRLFDHPWDEADSYTVANLYATYRSPSEHLGARVYLKNATDEEYLYNIMQTLGTGQQGNYAPPRHYGVEVSYRF